MTGSRLDRGDEITFINVKDAWPNSWDDLAIAFDKKGHSYLASCARGEWLSVITQQPIDNIRKWVYLNDFLKEDMLEREDDK